MCGGGTEGPILVACYLRLSHRVGLPQAFKPPALPVPGACRVTVIERPAESRNATGEPAAGRVVLRNLVVDSAPLVLAGER